MNKYDWSNKEKFLKDWDNSKNICSFLKDKGLTFTSGNYKTFNKWYNIHTSDLSTNEKKSLGNIFSENSIATRKQLNKKIKQLNLLKYECAGCSNLGIWNGKPLVLQLEHKNGINNDNRIENLEYLCPNCHSQTTSFAGSNVHNKIFESRIIDIVDLKQNIISKDNIITLSKIWNTNYNSILKWLRRYESKLHEYNIKLNSNFKTTKSINKKEDYLRLVNDNEIIKKLMDKWNLSEDRVKRIIYKLKKETENDLHISNKYKEEMKKNDIKAVLIGENPVDKLSQMWDMEKFSVRRTIKNLNLDNLHKDFKIKEVVLFDKQKRIEDVSILTNKKQVLDLSKKWNTSVNGAKKWIRNNLPDKFKEIYDDKHLEKNKKKVLQQEKINYIKSLEEDFNEVEVMNFLSISKIALYTQIKAHNPDLLEKVHNKHLCPKCNYKTRSNGQYRRCLDCNHNFKPKINQAENV